MNLQTLLQNKHTTGVATVYLVAAAAGHIGGVWFPHYADQLDETIRYVKEACFIYGMALAGDSTKKSLDNGSQSGSFNTDQLRRALSQPSSDPKDRIINPPTLPNKP